MVHELDLSSIRFARDWDPGQRVPWLLRVAEAQCSCGLRYHVRAATLSHAVMLLSALVLRHAYEMQQIGEPVRRWPIIAG